MNRGLIAVVLFGVVVGMRCADALRPISSRLEDAVALVIAIVAVFMLLRVRGMAAS